MAFFDNSDDKTVHTVVIISMLFGFVLRMRQYLFNRSIWLDEAALANNIVGRSFAGLTQTLDYGQGAPIGFLFIQKLMVTLFGGHDYILRLFPLIAGVVSLYLFYQLARDTMAGFGQVLANGLFSISTYLVYYSSECKQYSSDVMACLLLMIIGQRCFKPDATQKDFNILAFAGVIMLWISHPSLFVCCGVGVALLSDLRRNFTKMLMIAGLWALNFLFLYVVSFRSLAANAGLMLYWDKAFMPMPPWINLAWFSDRLSHIFKNPIDLPIPWLAPLLAFAGLVVFLMRKRSTGIMLCTTLVVTLLASGLRKYPVSDRLFLFAVPMVFLCIGTAVEQLRFWLQTKHVKLAIVFSLIMAVILLGRPTVLAVSRIIRPKNGEDIKTVLKYVATKKSQGDALYIYNKSDKAFNFYASHYGLDKQPIITGIDSSKNPEGYYAEIPRLKGHELVWFIFSHNYKWGEYDELSFINDMLSQIGIKIDEIRSVDAGGYLYQMK